MKFPVSLVIITLNEADGIARAIASAPFCDDVVVLDTHSTDGTGEIAKNLGARVFVEEWRGFQAQKQRAVELAKNKWILSLDGDEALSPELSREIEGLLENWSSNPQSENSIDGYRSPRLTWTMGRWIRRGGWYPDWQLRFFHRDRARWVGGHVHERVEAKRVASLRAPILHWPFQNHTEQVSTNNRYSSLGAAELSKQGKGFGLFRLLTKPVSKFLETYVLKRGFLDGMPGFIIAVGAAYSIFLKYAKLWEIQNVKSQNESKSLSSS